MTRMTRLSVLLVVLFAMSVAVGCKKKQQVPDQPVQTGTQAPQAKEVMLYQYRFNPNSLTVPAGTQVVFKNKDPERHNVRIAALNVDQNIDPNDSWSYTFNTKGEFAVDNRLATNPMSMTIVVE